MAYYQICNNRKNFYSAINAKDNNNNTIQNNYVNYSDRAIILCHLLWAKRFFALVFDQSLGVKIHWL